MISQRIPIKSIRTDKELTGASRGKIIFLRREGAKSSKDFFKINSVIGEGQSCICYEATLIGEGKTGRLKEFYPAVSLGKNAPYMLTRTDKNYVVAAKTGKEVFVSERDEYIKSYHFLRSVMEKNKANADFTSFIPDFSIYYACDEEGNFVDGSTAYIWTDPENLVVFSDYISDIHKHPTVYPEHRLFTVLKTTATLADCVKVLHENGLLHLDIKPSNFGIPQRRDKLLTDTITLFDVNSIYSLVSSSTSERGTEGFSAPELLNGRADNTSDIYSIGCTLFSALIVNDEIESLGYSREYYNKIPELVESSKLICASETNSNVFLKRELSDILKKCLADSQKRRYQSCTELAKDLERALAYLYPSEINMRLPADKKLVILEKELDKNKAVSSYITFMYHLYKRPLYEFVPLDRSTLDILIVGFGNYGQKFLDCCLQLGQIRGKRLNVRVISGDKMEGKCDRDIYLSARPALLDFFSIDGSECENSYGSIVFENREFSAKNTKNNKMIVSELVGENSDARYVFVALGDDSLNQSVASAICAEIKGKYEASVNFAFSGEKAFSRGYATPVYTSKDITDEPLYKDIERMAFNTHLVWENGSNVDRAASRESFREAYNYNASISNAISVKYKLHSVGIQVDDLCAAANQFETSFSDPKQSIEELSAIEHRRWVTEKLCDGWTCNRNFESCVSANWSNRKAKEHVCLVKSTSFTTLDTPAWSSDKWDKAKNNDLMSLDELDRVSVKLHQAYKKAADQLRKESALIDSVMLKLKSVAMKSVDVSIAFSEWFSCLTLLWNENESYVRPYEKLKNSLLEAVSELDDDSANTAKTLIKLIDKRFSVILKSMQYTDYKKREMDIVKNIPFILTYRTDMHLVIPFSFGSNTAMFSNVASATVSKPSAITYLYHFDSVEEIEPFCETVRYVSDYLEEKNEAARINFVISYKSDSNLKRALLEKKKTFFTRTSISRLQKVMLKETESDFRIAEAFLECLEKRPHIDAVEKNKTPLSRLLVGAGFYAKYPSFEFDMGACQFFNTSGCDCLKFIKSVQYLKVSDMFASKNSKGYLETPAAFYNDYIELWQKAYRKNENVWKRMCTVMRCYHENSDRLFSIQLSEKNGEYKNYRFLIPSSAYEGARKLISAMEDAGIFAKSSEVYYYTTDSCEVNLLAPVSIGRDIKSLFANPYILSQSENLSFEKTPFSISVYFDHLSVKELDLRKAGSLTGKVKELLKSLEEDFAFITDLTVSQQDELTISFTYATKRIKHLLTNEGNILEVYIYHKCLQSGLFDDIATGYEISWEGTSVTSEFDIIATKGFSGLLIEAKATEKINQEYYFKLSSLANQFGINSKPVLVADTVEMSFRDNSVNDMQRMRGEMMNVITISDPQAIDAIDVTLAKLLNIEIPEKKSFAGENSQSSLSDDTPSAAMTREEFLSRKITVLITADNGERLEQSEISLLQNNGVSTIKDFLMLSEADFFGMKTKRGIGYTAHYLNVQKKLKARIEKI